jgi:DNA-binding transcriptional ArsR family regulator
MSENRWTFLDELRETLEGPEALDDPFFMALAERLEEAVSAPTYEPLDELKSQLSDFVRVLLQRSPGAVRDAIVSRIEGDEASAYRLGHVAFAQLFAAQAANRRADDGFVSDLQKDAYASYVQALFAEDRTGQALAEITGERAETVSRKLKVLRDMGAVDYRRDGTSFYNFLTPAARAAAASWVMASNAPVRSPKERKVDSLRNSLPHIMREPLTFERARKESAPGTTDDILATLTPAR